VPAVFKPIFSWISRISAEQWTDWTVGDSYCWSIKFTDTVIQSLCSRLNHNFSCDHMAGCILQWYKRDLLVQDTVMQARSSRSKCSDANEIFSFKMQVETDNLQISPRERLVSFKPWRDRQFCRDSYNFYPSNSIYALCESARICLNLLHPWIWDWTFHVFMFLCFP